MIPILLSDDELDLIEDALQSFAVEGFARLLPREGHRIDALLAKLATFRDIAHGERR